MTQYISVGSVLASVALPPLAYATGSPAPVRRRRGRRVDAHRRSGTARTWRACCAGTERRIGVRLMSRRTLTMRTIAVLGAGSWGTALAVHLGRVGHDVRLWARDAGAGGRDRGAPRERRLSARRLAARRRRRSRHRCAEALSGTRARRVGDSLARLPGGDARRPRRSSSPRADDRQRDEGPREPTRCCGCRR